MKLDQWKRIKEHAETHKASVLQVVNKVNLDRSASKPWFDIQNKDDERAKVYVYDFIDPWGVSANDFAAALNEIEAPTLEVHINSRGGDVFEGIAILNTLRDHKATIEVHIDGVAASAASFIAMAGDKVIAKPNSQMMIHDAWGVMVGNADDMRDYADMLDMVSDNIADVYSRKAGGSASKWRSVMKETTWYSAEGMVDAGLADELAEADDSEESNQLVGVAASAISESNPWFNFLPDPSEFKTDEELAVNREAFKDLVAKVSPEVELQKPPVSDMGQTGNLK